MATAFDTSTFPKKLLHVWANFYDNLRMGQADLGCINNEVIRKSPKALAPTVIFREDGKNGKSFAAFHMKGRTPTIELINPIDTQTVGFTFRKRKQKKLVSHLTNALVMASEIITNLDISDRKISLIGNMSIIPCTKRCNAPYRTGMKNSPCLSLLSQAYPANDVQTM